MSDLTIDQVLAARDNDLDAVTTVCRETEKWVSVVARRNATTSRGVVNADLHEELTQVGRIAVWQNLARFGGSTMGEFYAYLTVKIESAITEARQLETRQGVSQTVTRIFEAALTLAGGDPYDAERLAASDYFGHRKLSAAAAYDARMAWFGPDSLDRPVGEGAETERDRKSVV